MKWLGLGLGLGFGLGYTNPNPKPEQVSTMKVGDSLTGVAIDAGFGEYSERACATLGIEQAPAGLKAGMEVLLQVPGGKQRARVTVGRSGGARAFDVVFSPIRARCGPAKAAAPGLWRADARLCARPCEGARARGCLGERTLSLGAGCGLG